MKTYMASPADIERKWYVVDATEYTLGRLASEVAKVLRGKKISCKHYKNFNRSFNNRK